MASLKCYNYTTHRTASFKVGLLNSNDLQSVTSGTYTTTYGECTLTKSGTSISMVFNGEIGDITNYSVSTILDEVGIRCQYPMFGNIVGSIPEGTSATYGFSQSYSAPPKFWYKKEYFSTFDYNEYTLHLDGTNGTSVNAAVQDNYQVGLAFVFIPTTADQSSGVLGFISATSYTGLNNAVLSIQWYMDTEVTDAYTPDAGDKGFIPTDEPTKNDWPGTGGRPGDDPQKTNPDYPSDDIFQPGAPDESVASAIGSGFLTAYKMDTANLKELGKCLFSQTLTDALLNMAIRPLEFITSLCVFPCSPSAGAAVPIKLGRWECASGAATGALGFNANGQPLTHQFSNPPLDFGTVFVPENWGSFLDYTQTRVELFLPFIGSIDLDVSECMNGSVNVQYTVDFLTGMCVANVLCSREITMPSGKVIGTRKAQHSYQGNCAIQIPLSSESYGAMVGNLMNSCTRLIGNPAGVVAGVVEGMQMLNPSVTTKGSIVANSGFCAVLKPYIRITRPVTAAPKTYQEVVGYPSYINTSLAYCQDLCVCEDINLDNINGATQSELERIRRICREGVFV